MSVADDKIVKVAKDQFKRCQDWEKDSRLNFVFDTKFVNGDSQNLWQWPEEVSGDRNRKNRPCLTINKAKVHCLQIINDQRQNKSQVEIRPVGNGASYEAAKVFEGVIRHVEYISNAQDAYSNATWNQVSGGIGYWRILTEYSSDNNFDLDIKIKRVQDPLSIYMDPDIEEANGSDARFVFIFRNVPRKDFEQEYGKEDAVNDTPLGYGSGEDGDDWDTKDHVRVCEYYRRAEKNDTLHELADGSTLKESDSKDVEGLRASSVRSRDIPTPKIEWFKIAGQKIVDRQDWPGKYIPVVRLVGEEIIIDKKLDRRGHVRSLIDPQRMYNYWSSAAVEQVALIGKTPWVASVESVEGFEENYTNANVENKAWMPYRATVDGQKMDPPRRTEPAQMAPAYLDGMKIAQNELMMASGQYEANMGEKSNEVSGKAVQERQRQGENATYHYIDRFAQAIRFTGQILVDLIPKIYDVPRVIKIMAEDGTQTSVQVDPQHPESHTQMQDPTDDSYNPQQVTAIFNPTVGEFDVEADIGPAYATRRQEAFNALTQIIQSDPNLMPIVGDILFKAADFPLADEAAERLKNMVSPQAMGKAPDPHIMQLQQQMAQQHQVMMQTATKLAAAEKIIQDHDTENAINQYKAETDRMSKLADIDPAMYKIIIREMSSRMFGVPANILVQQHMAEEANLPQAPTPPPHPIAMQHAMDLKQAVPPTQPGTTGQ